MKILLPTSLLSSIKRDEIASFLKEKGAEVVFSNSFKETVELIIGGGIDAVVKLKHYEYLTITELARLCDLLVIELPMSIL